MCVAVCVESQQMQEENDFVLMKLGKQSRIILGLFQELGKLFENPGIQTA